MANNDLVFNYIVDLKKKNINYFDRARLVNKYIIDEKLTQRGLGEIIGVPHSTIYDWLLWLKISEDEYDELLLEGYNDTQIYQILRGNKKMKKETFTKKSKIEFLLEVSIKKLEPFVKRAPKTPEVSTLLLKLRDTINRILMYMDK